MIKMGFLNSSLGLLFLVATVVFASEYKYQEEKSGYEEEHIDYKKTCKLQLPFLYAVASCIGSLLKILWELLHIAAFPAIQTLHLPQSWVIFPKVVTAFRVHILIYIYSIHCAASEGTRPHTI